MSKHKWMTRIALITAGALSATASAQTSTFTYQGRLNSAGSPANGVFNLSFSLWDALAGGSQVGAVDNEPATPVSAGLFTVQLNDAGQFGPTAFTGAARWIQVSVNGTPLSPRQPLTATPYALYALGGAGPWVVNGADIHNTNVGKVGIGVAAPAYDVDISGDLHTDGRAAFGNIGEIGLFAGDERLFDFSHWLTDFSGTDSWIGLNSEIYLEPNANLTGANAKYFYGSNFWTEIPASVSADIRYVQGPYVLTGNMGTGTVDVLTGAFLSAQSEGNAVEHLGCEALAAGYGSAVIDNNYAMSLRTGHEGPTGLINDNYALHISSPEGSGQINNNIGIYIADQQSFGITSNWSIYSDGGRSHFADGVAIGTTTDNPYKLTAINQSEHAIFGKVEADTGAFGYGVYGQSDSDSGGGGVYGISPVTGVHGLATATSGISYGGYFRAESPAGYAGYFVGRGHFSGNVGLGVMNPVYRLHVAENTSTNDAVYVRNFGMGRAATFESLGAGGPSAVHCYKPSGAALTVVSAFSTGLPATDAPLAVAGGSDASVAGGGFVVCGPPSGVNIAIDNNEIMCRNNAQPATLALNADGGNINLIQSGVGNVGIGTSSPTLAKVQISVANQRCVYGQNDSTTFASAYFENLGSGPAGVFDGAVSVFGNVSKSGGSFRIDHPLDPANKYLYHSFVESPDMMNVYNGVVTTDERGYATVTMPDWFEALNREFRYQLTVIDETDSDDFVQVKVVSKLADNAFTLRTSAPHVEVSWQLTGIRRDPWAEAHRIPVEQDKRADERGRYVHPELYGQPADLSISALATPADLAGEGNE